MDFQDCIKFANEHPVCYVATMDGDQPRVRALLMWSADESGFSFITFSPKRFSSQLKANPKTEVCFYNNAAELKDAKEMRVTGKVEFLEDKETLDKAYEARAFLEPIVGYPLRPLTEAFRISSGETHFWTIPDVLKEPTLERIKF
jgi:pyridoxamine 5'-phosphate oxidase